MTKAERILATILSDDPVVEIPGAVPAAAAPDYVDVWRKAKAAGDAALSSCVPRPMIVTEHANPLDDNSPAKREWFVEGGVCGFASLHVKSKGAGAAFLAALKKRGLAGENAEWRKDTYRGGYYYWVSVGGQSLARKEAWADAAAKVLSDAGIDVYVNSRMD